MRTNALNLTIRFFVNAAAFSYWMVHPNAATHVFGAVGIPGNFTLEPGPCDGGDVWAIGRQPGGLGGGESAVLAEGDTGGE